jgi:hypothetical protein
MEIYDNPLFLGSVSGNSISIHSNESSRNEGEERSIKE